MPFIKLTTGEILKVAETTADRVRKNLTVMHVDKETGIKFAGNQVVLIYPDEYDLTPTVERLPGDRPTEWVRLSSTGVGDEESGEDGFKSVGSPSIEELADNPNLGAIAEGTAVGTLAPDTTIQANIIPETDKKPVGRPKLKKK